MALKAWNGTAFVDATLPRVNGSDKPKSAWIWNGSAFVQVWSAFTPMGMNKVDSRRLLTTMEQVPGWEADPAYPGTVMPIDGELVTTGIGTAYVHIAGAKSSTSYTHYFQIYVNGAPFGTVHTRTGAGTNYTLDFNEPGIPDGSHVTLWARTSAGSSTSNFISGASGTYLRIELA